MLDGREAARAALPGDPGRVSRALARSAWEQGRWIWHLAFYLLLGFSTLVAVVTADGARDGLAAAGLAAVLACWHWWFARRLPPGGGGPLPPAALYAGGVELLWFLLSGLSPAYFLLLFIIFPLVFSFLRLRHAIPAALLLNALSIWRSVALSGKPLSQDWAAIGWGLLATALGIGLAVWITRIIQQSLERRWLIGQLQTTRQELAAAEREAGRLAERGRLAREIHDTLAQGLISIVLLLEAAEETLPAGAGGARRQLEQALRTARENLTEARRLVWELRPEPLTGTPLGEALRRLARRLSEETPVAATATVTGTPRQLPADTEVALLRVAQEALANVRKHAGARRVTVTLSYIEDEVALDIRDDGRGFDGGAVCIQPGGGFGLGAMRERARELGGSFAVETAPGAGTTIAVSLPLDAAGRPAAAAPREPEEVP